MPKIKFEKVISFSSEDHVHVANNLLNNDPSKKWKCQSSGETQASVVLQLEKPCIISHIDIGNEHSAYVEVLVNRSTSTDSYKGLLVMSSFMTPLESRQSTNVSTVRMFSHDQLSKPESDDKWDIIKVICTQPFNRHVQYGLSFITLHSLEDKLSNMPSTSNKLGKFTLREFSPDDLSVGSLFAKRNDKTEDTKLKAAAAIREASSSPSLMSKRNSLVKPLLKDLQNSPYVKKKKNDDTDESAERISRNRDVLLYADDETAPNDKIDAIINKKNEEVKKRKLEEDDAVSKKKDKKVKKDVEQDLNASGSSVNGHSNKNSKKIPNKKEEKVESKKYNKQEKAAASKKKQVGKPFAELLNGVLLVISGIQNPERANIRKKALEMGAKYMADWNNKCTHLICAFTNTPKFNQVKGKGKIVNKSWIDDCYTYRKRLPWRRYALEKGEKQKPESEDEICELEDEVNNSSEAFNDYCENGSEPDTEIQDTFNDQKTDSNENLNKVNKQKEFKEGVESSDSIFDDDTDVGSDLDCKTTRSKVKEEDIVKFLDIFTGKLFYIDDNLDDNNKKLLVQHITAYNGDITRNLEDDVDIIITSDKLVNEVRNRKNNCLFITPDWVWRCHNEQKHIPSETYEL